MADELTVFEANPPTRNEYYDNLSTRTRVKRVKVGYGGDGVFQDVDTSHPLPADLEAYNGASWDSLRTPAKFIDLSAVTITTIATVWTPAAGKKIRLMGGNFSVSAAVSVLFEDNAGGTTVGGRTPKLQADTPYSFDWGNGVLLAAANNVLKATSSAAATITGHLYGTEE